jgi:hypothetical protein
MEVVVTPAASPGENARETRRGILIGLLVPFA